MRVYVKPNKSNFKMTIIIIWLTIGIVSNTFYEANNLSTVFLGIGVLFSVWQLKKETHNKKNDYER